MNDSESHSIKKTEQDKQSSANFKESDILRNHSGQSTNWHNSTEFRNNLNAVIPKKVQLLESDEQVKEFISQEDEVSHYLNKSKQMNQPSSEDEDISYHPKNQAKAPKKKTNSKKTTTGTTGTDKYDKHVLVGDDSDASNLSNKSIRNTMGKSKEDLKQRQDDGQWENNFYANVYGSIIDGETMNDQQVQANRTQMATENLFRGSQTMYEDNCFKKQMELRGGKLHQLITDQEVNNNRIFANRYLGRGIIGWWYFVIDCLNYFENFLIICLICLIEYHKTVSTTSASANSIQSYYAISALLINIGLMSIRNIIFEQRQNKITKKINNKLIQYLYVSQKRALFLPITWEKIKPGYIIKVLKGQEFPADCLILDIIGHTGQKCYVTCGPFDDNMSIVQKKSFSSTSNKTGNRQNEQLIADMINGQIKFEYNYYGYIAGSFKLAENPDASDFDFENVVMRGTYLRETPEVICLVLNVGQQVMGSIYKDPKKYSESSIDTKLQSYVMTQKSFDKAYKQQIRIFLIFLFVFQIIASWLTIYLGSNTNFTSVLFFEQIIIQSDTVGYIYYFDKFVGCLLIMLSSIPFSFSNIIHLLILFSTNFAEWDIDVIPAKIFFRQPHATLAFGKVAHIFFSRSAIQSEAHQAVKLVYCGGLFFKNQYSQRMWQDFKNKQLSEMDMSFSSSNDDSSNDAGDYSGTDDENGNNSQINYFPNELINLAKKFQNSELDSILQMEKEERQNSAVFNHVEQLFRALTLCHQCQLIREDQDINSEQFQYIGIFNDEITTVEFAFQHGYRLVQRKKKQIIININGNLEMYDELGLVETRAMMGHFMTICAVRIKGQSNGILYMKGSIATLKHYLTSKDSDLEYLNVFQQRFIQSGQKSVVYAKRILSQEETNQLIITLNEGVSQTKQNKKLEQLLQILSNKQLEILGILGIQKGIHLRNRVVIDDMILNGVKPWIISQDVEQSHLTSLNSMRVFQGCASPLLINGNNQKQVQDQVYQALRTMIERLESNQQQDIKRREDAIERMKNYIVSKSTYRMKSWIAQFIDKLSGQDEQDNLELVIKNQKQLEREFMRLQDKQEQSKQTERGHQNLRNCVVFTGKAMNEIFRDLTMQKSFMTLAYLSDMLVGSEIKPMMKQKIIYMAKNFIGEGEYTVAILTTPEDQFMVFDSDLSVNLKDKLGKSTDFQAIVDVTLKDFSALSYLLFKHGNQIQQRLSKAVQAFIYKTFLLFAILVGYMVKSAFSTSIPFLDSFYFFFMLFMSPLQVLIFAMFYKDYGNEYYYRIFGHYKYNFSFTMVEPESIAGDFVCLMIDWLIIFFPNIFMIGINEMCIDGKNTASETQQITHVLLVQAVYYLYFCNTSQTVLYALFLQSCFLFAGCLFIFDGEGLSALQMLARSPSQILTLMFQILILILRNYISDIGQKMVFSRYSSLYEWYQEIEERLAFEEFENINQIFSINQNDYLYHKINSSNIERTLKLINQNMIKCTKDQGLEQILEKINSELDYSRRGQMSLTGTINRLTLRFNDLNKEAEYQINKNAREITYVRKQLIIFVGTTLSFSLLGMIFYIFIPDFSNVGVIYYIILSFFTILKIFILPYLKVYISRLLFMYTVVIICCYTVYTSQSQSLQPCGLIFVLAYVAGLNHSYVYPTIIMIMASVFMFVFFSLVSSDFEKLESTISGFRSVMWILTGLCWSLYVYFQELEKRIQFVKCYSKVRNYIKLKALLNILVPTLVRDKISSGKKNFAEDEGEGTIIFIEICNFDEISKQYNNKELIELIDQVYNQFDILCDLFGIQKIDNIGKKYMASAGLKSVDKKIDSSQLNKHHSVRIIDYALEILNYCKNVFLKNGTFLQVKIGVHTGTVVSVLVGDIKPQFSLIGRAISLTNSIVSLSVPNKVTISQQTQHYLELYTNNLSFTPQQVSEQDKKRVNVKENMIYTVSKSKGRVVGLEKQQDIQAEVVQQIFQQKNKSKATDINPNLDEKKSDIVLEKSEDEESEEQEHIQEYGAIENQNSFNQYNQQNDQMDNESNQSDDKSDEGKMNVFEFNDDLGQQVDDRLIIQNPTENAKYNLVERPKYLLTFENKESENEFLFKISKMEAKKTSYIMIVLCVLNKLIIIGDQIETQVFSVSSQFIAMFPIFIIELVLIYKLNNPKKEQIQFWTYITIFYGVIVMSILLSLEMQYLGFWSRAGFNELLLELTMSLFFFMRNIQLRVFVYMYLMFGVVVMIFAIIYRQSVFQYQCLQFLLGQILYFILLCCGLHHREMIQRKSLNYERVLNYESKKTNELISNLIPFYLLNDIINEKKSVDQFDDMTILQVEILNFVEYNKDVIKLLSRLFSRFDQLTQENRVYKVQTVGDLYIVMGYSGRVDQNKRTEEIILDETIRIIQTAFQMLDILEEVKKQMVQAHKLDFSDVKLRIGIHTGHIIAGFIGQKVVKYDIFGDTVLVAHKIKNNTKSPGMVKISHTTKAILDKSPRAKRIYNFDFIGEFRIKSIERIVLIYQINKNDNEIESDALNESNDSNDSRGSEFGSHTTRSMQSQQKLILNNNSDSDE